ncbi:transcription factor bHLH140 isoform X2 [Asparagus officinalis]|uniref:transcription factor bHLH140 isoform X2 n=1 Tax=Asparagus officinalis TaxID=4686 RepID=UPI00098E341D|nr:transcription factor bHLH140 isoform X2 [Asparagus officinalis]
MDLDANPQHQEEKPKGIVVILSGAPGSGKSTFCNDVLSAGRRSWVRVCQDTIANGKAGTKSQCLKSAAAALKEGKSVFIDRCNLEKEQRAEFVKLGDEQVDVHAVVLDLPAKVCISRSVKRSGHEGNLQGGKAAAVVNRMLQKKELPKVSEGFSRITFCQNENDVRDAVKIYSNLGQNDNLPAGNFGQKSPDAKVQLGIMKFLKKVENPKNASNGSQGSSPKQEIKDKDPCFMELENEHENKEGIKLKDSLVDDIPILAFPSISTSDFQFDHGKASDVIVESVIEFLNKVDNVRLVLVDISHKSHMLSLVKEKAEKKNIDPNKFSTLVGDITRLCTEGKLCCRVIANAANWRLKPGGGGVNAAIFKAAGEDLEMATKERADTLSPGTSVAIPLPSTSPLYRREGVTHVIHVLGPNMNPQRPNCLKNDYVKGCKVLRDAYASLFENFASITRDQRCNEVKSSDPRNDASKRSSVDNLHNDQKNKRDGFHDSESNKKSKPDDNMVVYKDKQKNEKTAAKRTWGSWAQALHQMAMDPEKHKDAVIEIFDEFVALNDLYPKAKKHILVVSRLPGLDSIADVQKEHLPLLKTMHDAGLKWAEKFLKEDASLTFRLGYHSVPSMRQLHLHVISQDFDSPHLKNKKHWNSFNTLFFRDSTDVIEEVEKSGEVTLNDENLLSVELRCHRCRSAHPNIPRLKFHISNCKASISSTQRLVFASS